MKKSILFLVMAMSMLYYLCSCEKSDNSNDIETEETEEYVELGLSLKGIDISTSPMSTKASSSDLYCVGIYNEGEGTSGLEYAAWLTDDITSEKIKLRKGKKYQCKVIYFPNGKNVLADYKTGSVYPICGMHLKTPKLEDGVIYDNNYGWGNLILGAAKKKGDADSGMAASGYYFNDVVRYHGGTIIEANADIEAEVNLYLQMYELNVEVKNFTEGYIDIKSAHNCGYGEAENNNAIRLTPDNPTVKTIRALDEVPFDFHKTESEFKDFTGSTQLNVYYTDTEGKSFTIGTISHGVKRMHRLNVSLDLEEILESINAGLIANPVEGEEWIDENYEMEY